MPAVIWIYVWGCADKSSWYTIQHTCMNETVYRWTFKFHKVVWQQNSGVVEDFIPPYSAVYLRIQKWKNYWNRSTFAKVIAKSKSGTFFMAHGVYSLGLLTTVFLKKLLTFAVLLIYNVFVNIKS